MLKWAVTPTAGSVRDSNPRPLVVPSALSTELPEPAPIVTPPPPSVEAAVAVQSISDSDTLAGHESELRAAEQAFGLPYYVLTAIAVRECSYSACSKHNAWGLGPGIEYASWTEGIEAAARNLRYWIDKRGSLPGALCTWYDGGFPCSEAAAAYASSVIYLMSK